MCEKFELRSILIDEWSEAAEVEAICFPPNEACSPKHIKERVEKASEMFLVAIDKETGKMAGFLNGLATDEEKFSDDFFLYADLYNENGKNVMLLGLDVLPEYRMQGLGKGLVQEYIRREQGKGRERLILTCLEPKVEMYKKMGFTDHGISGSSWGGEEWHEMSIKI